MCAGLDGAPGPFHYKTASLRITRLLLSLCFTAGLYGAPGPLYNPNIAAVFFPLVLFGQSITLLMVPFATMQGWMARLGRSTFPISLLSFPFYLISASLQIKLKTTYVCVSCATLQGWMARLGRSTFPISLLSFPFYLIYGSPGRSHSHYHPHR
jgi:hypothetical protein